MVQSVSKTENGRPSTNKDDVLKQDSSMVRVDCKDTVVDEVGKAPEFVQRVRSWCRWRSIQLLGRWNCLSHVISALYISATTRFDTTAKLRLTLSKYASGLKMLSVNAYLSAPN